MRKELWTFIGFVLFCVGFISILLGIVGVDLIFLLWMDSFGGLASFLLKIAMIIVGVVIVVLTRVDWAAEEELMEE